MGVTDNRRNVFLSQNSLTRNGESSSEDDGWEMINAESSDESSPPVSQPIPTRNISRPQIPAKKKAPSTGHRLTLKKGRRSVHRYMEEKNLFQSYLADETNDDDCLDGWDVGYQESRSYFTFLLDEDNDDLLNDFVENSEKVDAMVQATQKRDWKNNRLRKNSEMDEDDSSNEDNNDPEEAFLSISQNLRQAFKKHLPLGMLEALESEIVEFFMENPNTDYISSELSSYERLLIHAASSYNRLYSRSYDDNGRRILLVENRNKGKEFNPIDPSLTKYLQIRNGKCT